MKTTKENTRQSFLPGDVWIFNCKAYKVFKAKGYDHTFNDCLELIMREIPETKEEK